MSKQPGKGEKTFGVLLRNGASEQVENATYGIDGLARAIFFLAAEGELVDEKIIALMELAKAIEEKAAKIMEVAVNGDRTEVVEIEDGRILLAE